MNKKRIKQLTIAGISCAGLGITGIAATAVSCAENSKTEAQKSQVVAINKKYADKKAELQNEFGLPKFTKGTYDTTGKALVENAKQALKDLKYFEKDNFSKISLNEQIWLKTYIYNWETEINNWNNGLQYLGGNPSGGALPLNPNSNHLDDNIKSAINIYEIDEETLEPIKDDKHIDVELARNYQNMDQALVDYISSLKAMLNKGMEFGVMPNNITKKLFISQMLNNYYENELLYWANQSVAKVGGQEIQLPVVNPQGAFEASNAMLSNFKAWSNWAKNNGISQTIIDQTKKSLQDAQAVLDDFITWYANTYYTSNKSYGTTVSNGEAIPTIKLTKTAPSGKVERVMSVTKNDVETKIYGTEITEAELKIKNVGIGFMKSTLKIDVDGVQKSIDGNAMYQALLQFNNSVNKTPEELVKTGTEFVATTTENMHSVAQQVAMINNPSTNSASQLNWNPTVWYDADINDKVAPVETPMQIYNNGSLNFTKFNNWLNQEDFFFGREKTFWDQTYTGVNNSTNKQLTNAKAYITNGVNPEFDKYLDTLTKLGYAGPNGIWNNNGFIYGENSVKGHQALAGAVLSLVDYNNFKNETNEVFNHSFNEIPDYNVAPYNEKIQDIIGVGLEGPRGSNIFNYNVNPYFSLPKWSQSSFQNHEGKMGHHTQQAYWTKYMQNGDGANGTGPGYVFKQDAFHEGWAVFAEWYANELNVYGSKLDATTRLPSDWLNANGFVPSIKNPDAPTAEEINAIKNFQAGAYWQAASGADGDVSSETSTNEAKQAVAAVKIANMLQYYGYLNEAQLRNMRLAVDPLYHHKGSTTASTSGIPAYGASIQDVRNYLSANSGLGQGDIQSESYRYLNMPSQATGYMTGKSIFEKCYKAVKEKYTKENPGKSFLKDGVAEVRKLFDLMLRNGEIPLDTLQWIITSQYNVTLK